MKSALKTAVVSEDCSCECSKDECIAEWYCQCTANCVHWEAYIHYHSWWSTAGTTGFCGSWRGKYMTSGLFTITLTLLSAWPHYVWTQPSNWSLLCTLLSAEKRACQGFWGVRELCGPGAGRAIQQEYCNWPHESYNLPMVLREAPCCLLSKLWHP